MTQRPRFVYIEGQGNERLVRDTFSMGVIDTNKAAYDLAKRQHAEATKRMADRRQESLDLQQVKKDSVQLQQAVTELQQGLLALDGKMDLLLKLLQPK